MAVNVDKDKCLRCGGCVSVCSQLALDLQDHGIECDADKCVNCSICVQFCPVEALSLAKKK
ncbi:MAG: 4Fe-4S binding protein [Candidatus Aenigmarchaeota archaeon]|nr:4Fe-4S binding protein [Candidatus Aenigmarchaeota archaeon]